MDRSPTSASPRSQAIVPPHRPPTNRACDRCRRRKARCDFAESGRRCTNCRESGQQCSFDLPLARRGPKTRRRNTISALQSVDPRPVGDSSALSFAGSNPTAELTLVDSSATSGPSEAHWEASHALNVDPALSPQTIHSSVSDAAITPGQSALQRWHNLSRALAFLTADLNQLVTRCFDLFFEYLYPLTPLVHEPSLRDALAFFVTQAATGFSPASNPTSNGGRLETWPDATFTLITAVCAEAAFLLPKDLFPEGQSVADIFLKSSRSCLNHYLEADLESPNANSIAIRYFHSNCLHAAGKPKYSWHIFGEATRLAQVMQLHEETSLEGLFPIEAELRRRAFWIVYMGDKSAAILNNRPITIHQFSFESGITTAYPTGIEDESSIGVSPGSVAPTPETRKTFIAGFNANLRLWQTASNLLLQMRLLQDQEQHDLSLPGHPPLPTPEDRSRLDALYIQFITCLDDLPPYLQSYTFAAIAGAGKEATKQNQFIIQCANLQVSMHCLRMVITQKFEERSFFSTGVEQADLRKTEIARDMLRVIHEAPFWSLQVNGEPYVEKIRLIGASLLEIIHRNRTSPIATRARSDFTVLLDLLTRLDSKASDALRNNSTWVV
ncbi:putative C6 transcription factor [Ilyonectria robusta]|uniref:putative C6 transcription factor n=1 Tax=Ilyonectria robusta TaxID=1079257 RepID=UPI001E8D2109|nr:putative C6 transcription factor [Ilyonectria robusta]KAH8675079.1 putative C6 transcription factor [Ilyonectria robusta]